MLHTSCCLSSSSLFFVLSMLHGGMLSLDAWLFSLCSLSWILLCQYAVAAVARVVYSSSSSPLCHSTIPLSLVLIVDTPLSLWLPLTPSLDLPSLPCVGCWVNIVLFFSISWRAIALYLKAWSTASQRFYHPRRHVMPTLCPIKMFRCHIFPVKSCRRHHRRVW